MNNYKIAFFGRRKGALGKTFPFTVNVSAPTVELAKLSLYDSYDHIRVVSVKPIMVNTTVRSFALN
jgi:hypothetical protein